jgi:hypothetical protein
VKREREKEEEGGCVRERETRARESVISSTSSG